MVRVIGYGEVDARIKPGQVGVGAGCDLFSAAPSTSAVSVMQACSGRGDLEPTLLQAADQDQPELRTPLSTVSPPSRCAGAGGLRHVDGGLTPGAQAAVVVYDNAGTEESSADLRAPPTPGDCNPALCHRRPGLITWWTGNSLVVFDANRLAYRYTIPTAGPTAPLGPATMMANKLWSPSPGGWASTKHPRALSNG